ncbi:MAG: methyltransferase domain-containing protein [Anaerolineaceae bacterium]|nr:methyltransferase domain-containing protein [Anaerolineaceae bacterium]
MIDISNIPADEPVKLIIGAGSQMYPGWIPTQKEDLNLLDRQDWVDSFSDRKVDLFLCEHVWEHLTLEEAHRAAALCYEFLKPGGNLRVAVPDGNFPPEDYQRMARGDAPPGHPAADHKTVYTYKTFPEIFCKAGFETDLLEYCDDEGRFHYNQWNIEHGLIYRSLLFDHRNRDGALGFVSLIIDATKPSS